MGGILLRVDGGLPLRKALNCNLREDTDQLRVAYHDNRAYRTIDAVAASLDFDQTYELTGVISSEGVGCRRPDGTNVESDLVISGTNSVGLFVYDNKVRFESITVRNRVSN